MLILFFSAGSPLVTIVFLRFCNSSLASSHQRGADYLVCSPKPSPLPFPSAARAGPAPQPLPLAELCVPAQSPPRDKSFPPPLSLCLDILSCKPVCAGSVCHCVIYYLWWGIDLGIFAALIFLGGVLQVSKPNFFLAFQTS